MKVREGETERNRKGRNFLPLNNVPDQLIHGAWENAGRWLSGGGNIFQLSQALGLPKAFHTQRLI